MKSCSRLRFMLLLFALCMFAGCQQRAASKLQGRWEGRPDSAAKRAERDAKKYGDQPTKGPTQESDADAGSGKKFPGENAGEKAEEKAVPQVTDWEGYDVTIVMDFLSSDRVEMSLDDGQQVEGQWKILTTTPSGCMIEVETQSQETQLEDEKPIRRRFELLFDERDGECVGYQLTEAGADARVGALYFQRPADSESANN